MADKPFRRGEATPTTTPPDLAASKSVDENDNAATAADALSTDGATDSADGYGQPSAGQAALPSALGPLQDSVGQIVEQAQGSADAVLAGVARQTTSRLAAQKGRVAATLMATAQAVRQTSQQLRDQDQAAIAGYAETLAQQAERLSTYLQERDVQTLVDETERFARQRPALFFGGAFALGLLAARFLKSGRPQQGMIPPERSLVPVISRTGYTSSVSSLTTGTDTPSPRPGTAATDRTDAFGPDAIGDETAGVREPRYTFRAELPDDMALPIADKPRRRRSRSAIASPEGGRDADKS